MSLEPNLITSKTRFPKKPKNIIQLAFVIFSFVGVLLVIWFSQSGMINFDNRQKASTIVFFSDQFESTLSNWEINRPTSIITSTERVREGSKSLRLDHPGSSNTMASKLFPTDQTGRISVWIYDDLSNVTTYTYFSVSDQGYTDGVSVGIKPDVSTANYVYCPSPNFSGCIDTGMRRTTGWQHFKIFVTPKGTYGKINNISFSSFPDNAVNPAVNTKFTKFKRINLGVTGAQRKIAFFDYAGADIFPPAPSDTEIAKQFINLYLTSYGNLDIQNMDRMIKVRESEYCSHTYNWDDDGDPTTPLEFCRDTGDRSKGPHQWWENQFIHMITGMLNTSLAHISVYKDTGNMDSLNKAISIIELSRANLSLGKTNDPGVQFIVASSANTLSLASWAIWDQLTPTQRQNITTYLINQGNYTNQNYILRTEENMHISNSPGEENAYTALFLNNLAIMYRHLPESRAWAEKAKLLGFHTFTRDETYGGYTTRTIYDDYTFDNHQYHPHAGYGLGTAYVLAAVEQWNKKHLGSSPSVWRHNTLNVWQKMQQYVNYRDFQYKGQLITRLNNEPNAFYPSGKDDWGGNASSMTMYRMMKDIYGLNSISDPSIGFSTTDLARHAAEYDYYIKSGYLWRHEEPNIQLSEMTITANSQPNNPSYRWYANSQNLNTYTAYLFFFSPNFNYPRIGTGNFTNLSASLTLSLAQFNFAYSGHSENYKVHVSTSSDMSTSTYNNFVIASAPLTSLRNNDPDGTWSNYKCGTRIYWQIESDYRVKSPIQSQIVSGTGCTNQPPTISAISTDKTSYIAGSNIILNASASDTNGSVSRVEFYRGSTLMGSDTTAPYSYTWSSAPAGTYTFSAVAIDNAGARSTNNPTLTRTVSANSLPVVSTLTTYAPAYIAPATITISARASDIDGTVSRVEFYRNNVYLGADTTSPYSYTLSNVSAATYTFSAVAVDNAGARSINNPTVTRTVSTSLQLITPTSSVLQ